MSYEATDLIADKPKPKFILPYDSLLSAIPALLDHNERFLPVVKDKDNKIPIGLLTGDSIANAIRNFGDSVEDMRVIDVADKITMYREDAEVAEFFDDIQKSGAVAIVDKSDCLINTVTVNDISNYFHALAYDMILLEDIEKSLRDHIEAAYTDPKTGELDEAQLRSAINLVLGRDKPFGQLSLYESTNLFCHPRTWHNYGKNHFSITSKALSNLLDIVRRIRNPWAHFRANPSPAQRRQLKFAQLWFKRNDPVYPTPPLDLADITQHSDPIDSVEESPRTISYEEDESDSDSKYAKLATYLSNQTEETKQLNLSFDEIEKILGFDLPKSAREHRAWWANDTVGNSWSTEWLDVDWRVASVNMTNQTVRFARIKERQKAYIAFYSALINTLRQEPNFDYLKVQPDGTNWIYIKNIIIRDRHLSSFNYSFGRGNIFRVELYIDCGDQSKNKDFFDALLSQKAEIEKNIGHELKWQRLNHRRASRIARIFKGHVTDSEEALAELRQVVVPATVNFIQVLQPKAQAVGLEII